jgi:hypothetical protein
MRSAGVGCIHGTSCKLLRVIPCATQADEFWLSSCQAKMCDSTLSNIHLVAASSQGCLGSTYISQPFLSDETDVPTVVRPHERIPQLKTPWTNLAHPVCNYRGQFRLAPLQPLNETNYICRSPAPETLVHFPESRRTRPVLNAGGGGC